MKEKNSEYPSRQRKRSDCRKNKMVSTFFRENNKTDEKEKW